MYHLNVSHPAYERIYDFFTREEAELFRSRLVKLGVSVSQVYSDND